MNYRQLIETVECPEVGMPGHEQCGWCSKHGVPRAVCLCDAPKRSPHDELVEMPPIQLQALNWAPSMSNSTVVVFSTIAMTCQCCAFRIRAHSDALTNHGGVDGGQKGNVLWRSKGIDIADKCDFCGMDLSGDAAEELRFFVEVACEA